MMAEMLEDDGDEEDNYWEEEEEVEAQIGDGGDGGGVVLSGTSWGSKALAIAEEVLLPFKEDLEIFAFKVSDRGYIYVRLDKLSDNFLGASWQFWHLIQFVINRILVLMPSVGKKDADRAGSLVLLTTPCL
eukprot:Gb_22792 [translate_table: standard]